MWDVHAALALASSSESESHHVPPRLLPAVPGSGPAASTLLFSPAWGDPTVLMVSEVERKSEVKRARGARSLSCLSHTVRDPCAKERRWTTHTQPSSADFLLPRFLFLVLVHSRLLS